MPTELEDNVMPPELEVNVVVTGLALCYRVAGSNAWTVVFVCDTDHPLNLNYPGLANPIRLANRKDLTIEFTSNFVTNTDPGNISGLLNLSAPKVHEQDTATKSKLKKKRRPNKTVEGVMMLPESTMAVDDYHPDYCYAMQIEPLPRMPVQFPGRGQRVTATFKVTNDLILTVPGHNGHTHTFEIASTTSPVTIEFDNGCGEACHYNDSIDIYESFIDDSAGHEKKFVSWAWPPRERAEVFSFDGMEILSSKEGNCNPIAIDPPPA